ncbi:hypothetical protein ACWGS9_34520 [Bradyrhizobium sp. Arg314]
MEVELIFGERQLGDTELYLMARIRFSAISADSRSLTIIRGSYCCLIPVLVISSSHAKGRRQALTGAVPWLERDAFSRTPGSPGQVRGAHKIETFINRSVSDEPRAVGCNLKRGAEDPHKLPEPV